jgi:hypothetical protein
LLDLDRELGGGCSVPLDADEIGRAVGCQRFAEAGRGRIGQRHLVDCLRRGRRRIVRERARDRGGRERGYAEYGNE